MKHERHGQAEPLDDISYQKIRKGFKNEAHQAIFDIGRYTGERAGAILRLGVGDVYKDPTRRIPRETIIFKACTRKGNDTREVPISAALKLRLKAYRCPVEGFLFPSLIRPGEHLSDRAFDGALRRALQRAGLEDAGYSTHSMRRGFVTCLHNNGVAIRVIQALTGHKSLSVLAGYVEISQQQKEAAIATL